MFSKEKLDEIVKSATLCYGWVIDAIPSEEVLNLKKELKSRKELSNYEIETFGNSGNYNTLVLTKNYGAKR